MSTISMSNQRRALRAGRRRAVAGSGRGGQRREPSTEVIDVDTLQDPPPCIDLTEAPDIDFVDLTSANYNTPVQPEGAGRRLRSGRRRGAGQVQVVPDSDSDLEELPEIPFEIPDVPTRGSTGGQAAEPESSTSVEGAASGRDMDTSVLSPEMKTISCPVCLDSDKQIKRSGRRIMSTVCGHIFCDECIKASVKSQKRCPSCRKKLTNKQYHPLFL